MVRVKMGYSTSAHFLKDEDSFKSRLMLWVIAVSVLVLIGWSSVAELDELVRGEGKVIPSSQLKVVQSLDGGVLSELIVKEGERVSAGQLLMRLDDTRAKSKFNERQQSILNLEAMIQRLRAEVEGKEFIALDEELRKASPAIVFEQEALFHKRRKSQASAQRVLMQQVKQKSQELEKKRIELKHIKKEFELAKKEFSILKPLFIEGVVSEVELIKAEKSVLAVERQVLDVELKIPQVKSSIDELKEKELQLQDSFRTEAQIQLSEAAAELAQISQSHQSLEIDVDRTQIRSPVNGTIKQVMLTTVGGVVQPGMALVSIVPVEDTLIIETKVRPSDIARLYPGQKAVVKFTAYDFTVYGGLEAELVHISADSLTDEHGESFYLVRVKTQNSYIGLHSDLLPIIPGMQAQVDIITGKKTLLSYLLKPILRAKQVALTEQ